jgi:peptidoglycan/LPS O-acetylase OafA/YrhL
MSRVPGLDGVRGLAILMVLIFHASGYRVVGFGAMGVDLFFLLSGFLITHLLRAEYAHAGTVRLGAFAMHRAFRLLPALWFMVAVVLLMTWWTYPADAFRTVLADAAATLGYVSNWAPILTQTPNRLLGHSWSLSVEVQFYILWALFAVWALPRLRPATLFTLLVATVLAMGSWTAWIYQHGASLAHMVYGFDTRAAPLFAGCAIAMLIAIPAARQRLETGLRRKFWIGPGALAALIALALGFGSALPWILLIYAPSLAVLGALVLAEIMLVPDGWLARLLAWRPLVGLGTISYGLYLWHFPLMRLAEQHAAGWAVNWLVCFGVAPTVAALSWRFVERPLLFLKLRFAAVAPL